MTEFVSHFTYIDGLNFGLIDVDPESPLNFCRILTQGIESYDSSSMVSAGVRYLMNEAKYYLYRLNFGWDMMTPRQEEEAVLSITSDWFSLIPSSWFAPVVQEVGQAKIFVETLRVFVDFPEDEKKGIKIAVAGSSSPGVSGLSYPLLAHTLTKLSFTGTIDLYDPYEVDAIETIGDFVISHRPICVPEGLTCDVFLDDSYYEGRVNFPVLAKRSTRKHFSEALVDDAQEGVENQAYYKGLEKRKLEGVPPLKKSIVVNGTDNCYSCRRVRSVLAGLHKSAGVHEQIFAHLVRLGVSPCCPFPIVNQLKSQGELLARTASGAIVREDENFSPHSRKNIGPAMLVMVGMGILKKWDTGVGRPYVRNEKGFDGVAEDVKRVYASRRVACFGPGFSSYGWRQSFDAAEVLLLSAFPPDPIAAEIVLTLENRVIPGGLYEKHLSKSLLGVAVTEWRRREVLDSW
jgi:hypothetical protein